MTFMVIAAVACPTGGAPAVFLVAVIGIDRAFDREPELKW